MAGSHNQANGDFHVFGAHSYGCKVTVQAGLSGPPDSYGHWSNESTIDGVYAYYKADSSTMKCAGGNPGHGKESKWFWRSASCQACALNVDTPGRTSWNVSITNIHTCECACLHFVGQLCPKHARGVCNILSCDYITPC
jgi:hypothetical protein